jgi:hypothetical protein
MTDARVTYTPHSDTNAAQELCALSAVYSYVLDCRAKKEAAHPAAPNEAKGSKDDRPAERRLPK